MKTRGNVKSDHIIIFKVIYTTCVLCKVQTENRQLYSAFTCTYND